MKTLTGNTRTRAGWFGKLVLQVEVARTIPPYSDSGGPAATSYYWRDATVEDLTPTQRWAQTGKQPERMLASPPREPSEPSNTPHEAKTRGRLLAALKAERAESEQLRKDVATISGQYANLLRTSAPDAAKAKQLDKLMRYMGSGVSEGWAKIYEIGAVAAWTDIDSALAHLDSLPECNVGLCERPFTVHAASKQ